MNNFKIIYYFYIFIIFSSCTAKTEFSIKNNSNLLIDSIKISNGYDFIFTKRLSKGQTVIHNLKFTDLTPNFDGSFFIETYPNKKFRNFGYYTNGIQPDTHFSVEIKNDTILIKESRN